MNFPTCENPCSSVANLLSLRIFGASNRAVVQLGRTLEWGSRGRGFESRRPERVRFLIVLLTANQSVGALKVPLKSGPRRVQGLNQNRRSALREKGKKAHGALERSARAPHTDHVVLFKH